LIINFLKKNYTFSLVSQLLSAVAVLFYTPFLVHELDNLYGLIQLALTLSLIFAGFTDSVTQWYYNQLMKNNVTGDYFDGYEENFWFVIMLLLLLPVFIGLLVYLAGDYYVDLSDIIMYGLIIFVLQIITHLARLSESNNYLEHKLYVWQLVGVARRIIGILVVVGLFYYQRNLTLGSMIMSLVAEILFLIFIYKRRMLSYSSVIKIYEYFRMRNIKIIIPVLKSFVGGYIYLSQTNVLISSYLVLSANVMFGPERATDISILVVGYNIVLMFFNFIIKPAQSIASNLFHRSRSAQSTLDGEDHLMSFIYLSIYVSSLISVIGVAYSDALVNVWLGSGYDTVSGAMSILFFALVASVPSRSIMIVQLFSNKMYFSANVNAVAIAILSILMVLVETVVDLVVLVTSMIIINSIINMIYSITLIKGKIYDAIMPVTKVTIILSSMLFASDNLLLLNAVIAVISILTVYYFHHVYIFLRYKVV